MKSPYIHLILALVVCVLSLIGYGVWYTTITTKSATATTLQTRIDTKLGNISRLNMTRNALADMASDEMLVQNYFVSETGVVTFIDGLETRGRAQGTIINVLSVSTGGTLTQPTLEFALSIIGTFDAVMRTIGAIEYAPYAISVSTVSIGQDAKNSWHADVKLLVGSRVARTTTTP